MALQHGRTVTIQLPMKRRYNCRVVVAGIVDAVPGEKIEEAPAVFRMQLNSLAATVADVHLEGVKKPHPLRIYMLLIFEGGSPSWLRERQLLGLL